MASTTLIDLTGKRFGRLIVITRAPDKEKGRPMWLCRCDCETQKIIAGRSLRSGDSTSCGCRRRDRMIVLNTKHGFAKDGQWHPLYATWTAMKARCNYKKHVGYKNYGGRGISVCSRWRKSFQAFVDDMGKRPPGTTLDRKNNDKGYSKSNCRWASHHIQRINRRAA